jgi:hypothetical protein
MVVHIFETCDGGTVPQDNNRSIQPSPLSDINPIRYPTVAKKANNVIAFIMAIPILNCHSDVTLPNRPLS